MLDPQDEAFDRRLARHLVSLYYTADEAQEDETMVSRHRGQVRSRPVTSQRSLWGGAFVLVLASRAGCLDVT